MMKKLFAALCMLAALAGCGEQQLKFENTDLTGLGYGKGFSLNDHSGKPVTLDSYKGKVVVLFFGFTHCPDVCPTTMAEMSAVMKELGPDADKVQVLFATLDPERDTRELLAQYVPGFDPRFIGLYGTLAAAVVRSRRELAVRVALGAHPGSLRMLVVSRCLSVAALGLALGLPLAYAATKSFAHLLYGVRPFDPAVAGITVVIIVLTAAAAGFVPARRAARVDPVVALRAE